MSKPQVPSSKKSADKPSKAHLAARKRFIDTGTSIAHWARTHGYLPSLVYNVLAGRETHRGKSHEIAVLLGIKAGTIDNKLSASRGGK